MNNAKDNKYTDISQSKVTEINGMSNRGCSRGRKENDKFHTGLLFGVLIMAYGLNHAFGFDIGTIPYGTLFALAIAVWAVIAVVDYFKGSKHYIALNSDLKRFKGFK